MQKEISRRNFVQKAALGILTVKTTLGSYNQENKISIVQNIERQPRWRGFNLTDKLRAEQEQLYSEKDFAWIADWDFNFVRLPMDYRCWTKKEDWNEIIECKIKEIDHAIEYGKRYGIHVNLNMHRIPGHGTTVQEIHEPASLWELGEALDVAALHWRYFAERYKAIPDDQLSFNLLNEPSWDTTEEQYTAVVQRLTKDIREIDPERYIAIDGFRVASQPVKPLLDLNVAQSLHWYEPFHLTHWRAPWVSWVPDFAEWKEPTWPLVDARGKEWNKDAMQKELIPWREIDEKGCDVQVGEFGVYQHTPHRVGLAWMEDCLSLFHEMQWSWALWGFRGHFGILDTHRKDIKYESFHGHRLDRAMLELLKQY